MKLKCLIIDDEPPAHKVLQNYVVRLDKLELVGHCYNAVEALNFLHAHSEVDLIFLDIQMPELTGFDLIQTLERRPAIIMTTAYSEYALESYDHQVSDYLLKPIRFERFLKAVNRVLVRHIEDVVPAAKPTEPVLATHLFVKVDGLMQRVDYEALLYIEAYGNFVKLHTADRFFVTAETLTQMTVRLPESQFLRIHKSYVVHWQKVSQVEGNQVFHWEAMPAHWQLLPAIGFSAVEEVRQLRSGDRGTPCYTPSPSLQPLVPANPDERR